MFHHPVYASHTWREYPTLAEDWVPVFDRHHVDLVLQGHDHAYLRTYPMRAGRRVDSPGQGTVYVVSVSGDKFCEQDARPYAEVGFTGVSTYQTIEMKPGGRRLVYKAFDVDGRERDGFTIDRAGGVGQSQERQADPVQGVLGGSALDHRPGLLGADIEAAGRHPRVGR